MPKSLRSHLLSSFALASLIGAFTAAAAATPALAQSASQSPTLNEDERLAFNIPAGSLDAALLAFGRQSHQQLIYDAATVVGRTAPALKGRFTAADGLARLLGASGVTQAQTQPGVFVLRPAGGQQSQAAEAITAVQLDELVITGSLIRGAPPSSPVLDLDRDALDRSGKATVADMLAALPQNFAGAASPQTALALSDTLGTNDALAQGINLRGLGATATLVLVNGRRMAGSGLKGDFADVSAIPTAAVDRVEVLLDGASAIYGSDAVGGVVNVILRRDFDGAETRLRYGAAQGGGQQTQIGQALGKTWDGGHVLVAYEHQHDAALAASKRAQAASSDLRPFGGTDHRAIYSHAGNLVDYDPGAGAYVPTYAIPAGQNGSALTPADFTAATRNLENLRQDAQILPEQTRDSVYADVRQRLTSNVEVSADVRYTQRDFIFNYPGSLTIFAVSGTNPHFVSPTGAGSALIAYSFGDELGPVISRGRSRSLGASAGLDATLPAGWRGEAYLAYAQEDSGRRSTHNLNSGYLAEALGNTADDPTTSYNAARDGYFNPYGDGGANSHAILDFVGSGVETTHSISRVATANLKADGDLFALPGGMAQLAFGGQFRQERFKTTVNSLTVGSTAYRDDGRTYLRNISAAFAELRAPLVGADNARPGMQRLELSLAGRVEHYEDFGTTANPKIGVLWTPVGGLDVRATYGESFRAPALTEIYAASVIAPTFLSSGGAQTLVMVQYGGNLDLKPETAKSWTLGFDLKPAAVPGLRLSATAFDVRFSNRIGQPVLENFAQALSDPSYSDFVTQVSPATNAADQAKVQALIDQSTSSSAQLFPATAYGAIVDARSVNAARLAVRGLDLQVEYSFSHGPDHFDLAANATYLADYDRQLTPTATRVDLVSTAGQPVDLRARFSGAWSRGPFGVDLALNYVDSYAATPTATIDAWKTVDLQATWTAPEQTGTLKGLTLALSMQNLFDQDPPFYDNPTGVGYDPANADPIGRFVAATLTKRW
jgi:outer membrane receptor protein involved in Fe transport